MKNEGDPLFSGPSWRFLIDSASVVLLRVSPDGTILAANPQAQALIGEPLVGQPWNRMLLGFNGPVTLADWLADEARPRLLNVRTTTGLPKTLQVTVEPAGADYILFGEFNAAEQMRLGQEVMELNHELNNLSRELALKNAELARLGALKNQFLGMAAHDLRKPIGLILSYTEFLIDEAAAALSAEQRDFLQTIHRAANRMRGVVDDFLDVSLIEAGRFNIDEQMTDLSELVHSARALVNLSAIKRGVRIETDLDPAARHLLVDGAKIEQVLTNLLSNAVEHAPSGSSVRLTSRLMASELRLQVSDSGPGVALAQQHNLFQSFGSGQVRKSTGERSVGLGLAIARKVVEAHGGRMFYENAPGRGAVFGFTLPASGLSAARPGADQAIPIREEHA